MFIHEMPTIKIHIFKKGIRFKLNSYVKISSQILPEFILLFTSVRQTHLLENVPLVKKYFYN